MTLPTIIFGLVVAMLYGALYHFCLLYTSDAADERSSVDLGGRRIIEKKKKEVHVGGCNLITKTTYTNETSKNMQ